MCDIFCLVHVLHKYFAYILISFWFIGTITGIFLDDPVFEGPVSSKTS